MLYNLKLPQQPGDVVDSMAYYQKLDVEGQIAGEVHFVIDSFKSYYKLIPTFNS